MTDDERSLSDRCRGRDGCQYHNFIAAEEQVALMLHALKSIDNIAHSGAFPDEYDLIAAIIGIIHVAVAEVEGEQ